MTWTKSYSVGMAVGRLTILEFLEKDSNGRAHWKVQCDCGNVVTRSSKSISRCCDCGSHRGEKISRALSRQEMKGTPERISWEGMFIRCKYHPDYRRKEIKVCERWHILANFCEDMGPRPEGMSIERKNNFGDYEPGNCTWATRKEQCNNKDNNTFMEYDGCRLTVAQWSDLTGINRSTIHYRLKAHYPPEKVLSLTRLPAYLPIP